MESKTQMVCKPHSLSTLNSSCEPNSEFMHLGRKTTTTNKQTLKALGIRHPKKKQMTEETQSSAAGHLIEQY